MRVISSFIEVTHQSKSKTTSCLLGDAMVEAGGDARPELNLATKALITAYLIPRRLSYANHGVHSEGVLQEIARPA